MKTKMSLLIALENEEAAAEQAQTEEVVRRLEENGDEVVADAVEIEEVSEELTESVGEASDVAGKFEELAVVVAASVEEGLDDAALEILAQAIDNLNEQVGIDTEEAEATRSAAMEAFGPEITASQKTQIALEGITDSIKRTLVAIGDAWKKSIAALRRGLNKVVTYYKGSIARGEKLLADLKAAEGEFVSVNIPNKSIFMNLSVGGKLPKDWDQAVRDMADTFGHLVDYHSAYVSNTVGRVIIDMGKLALGKSKEMTIVFPKLEGVSNMTAAQVEGLSYMDPKKFKAASEVLDMRLSKIMMSEIVAASIAPKGSLDRAGTLDAIIGWNSYLGVDLIQDKLKRFDVPEFKTLGRAEAIAVVQASLELLRRGKKIVDRTGVYYNLAEDIQRRWYSLVTGAALNKVFGSKEAGKELAAARKLITVGLRQLNESSRGWGQILKTASSMLDLGAVSLKSVKAA